MLTYCLKCKKNAKTVDSKLLKANKQTNKQNGRTTLLSKCAAHGSREWKNKKQKEY